MGALCLVFPSTPPSCPCGAGAARSRVPVLTATPSPFSPSSAAAAVVATRLQLGSRSRGRTVVARVGGRGEGDGAKDAGAAAFFGEDGVVEDMDGYLDYLSLEYDSVWDTKPAWCQPWTILLTGTAVVACSWVLQSVIVTAGVSFIICAWWYIFLYSYPKAYTQMIAERRKKVASGAEDTYGMEKIQ
ncbi:uncharacterized protein LOC120650077 [Panicum virgatum]|uniref:DUF6737 domain-containing protein n=1 Tax=Panicum virgatum TaxID=38727 RepID=A0A8T0NIE1_PANVG|nr:uncharacterized protein LOC120650077 [Panicum virgatum]KAG2546624.1 hypothetical protein PVAP13_9KG036800 [Panicum virgatum]